MGSRPNRSDDTGADRRGAPRASTRVFFSSGRIEGHGLIEDISLTGAQIADAERRLQPGTRVRLQFALLEGKPIDVQGEVVRTTTTGFGVRFVNVDARLQSLLLAGLPRAREIYGSD